MCSLGSMNHYYNHFFSTLWFLYLSTFSPCLLPDSVYLSKIQLWLNSAPEPLNVSGDNHRSGRPALTFSSRSPVKAVQVTQSYPTRWDPTDYTVHGIPQARILEWVAVLPSSGSSQARDPTHAFSIAIGFFTSWATREAQEYWSGWPMHSPEFESVR